MSSPKEGQKITLAQLLGQLRNQTEQLVKTTEALPIPLLDHKVVSDGIDIVSTLTKQVIEAYDGELSRQKMVIAEKEREITEVKKSKKP